MELTLEIFEPFLAETSNSDLVSKSLYGVILKSEDGNHQVKEIAESDFDKYTITEKIEESELNSVHPTYPWVALV